MANTIPTELNWVIEEILSLIMTYLVLTDTEVRYVEWGTMNEASGLTWFQMRAWRMTAFSITRTVRPLTCILARSIWKLQVSVRRCNYITHHSSRLEITEIMRNHLYCTFGLMQPSIPDIIHQCIDNAIGKDDKYWFIETLNSTNFRQVNIMFFPINVTFCLYLHRLSTLVDRNIAGFGLNWALNLCSTQQLIKSVWINHR